MLRPFPKGRIGLSQMLADAGVSKNTFFRQYRYNAECAVLLDIEEDRDHRLHFPAEAGALLQKLHGKTPHGNRGRKPQRRCENCRTMLHPRNRVCGNCGQLLVSEEDAVSKPTWSAADRNFRRRAGIQALKSEGKAT